MLKALLKKRLIKPRSWVSAKSPVPPYWMRALAIRCDETVLSELTSSERTIPVTRMYSLPLLSMSHFSPRTTRLPLAKTLTTLTEILPVKLLDWLASELPSKSEVLLRLAEVS